jgi:uncharacterized protein (TIGR02147 family)
MKETAHILNDMLAKRQRRNPRYSLRAFARDLGLNAGSLSSVLTGRRPFPTHALPVAVLNLNLNPRDARRLQRAMLDDSKRSTSPLLAQIPHREKQKLDDCHFQVLSEWEHYALLTLMDLKAFQSDEDWIAQRLNISVAQVRTVIDRLVAARLITRCTRGKLTKTCEPLSTTEDVASPALVKAHKEELQMANDAIDNIPMILRDMSSVMLAMPASKVEQAKKIIRQFRKDFCDLLEGEDADEVFQLSVQFFPLSRIESNTKSKEVDA